MEQVREGDDSHRDTWADDVIYYAMWVVIIFCVIVPALICLAQVISTGTSYVY